MLFCLLLNTTTVTLSLKNCIFPVWLPVEDFSPFRISGLKLRLYSYSWVLHKIDLFSYKDCDRCIFRVSGTEWVIITQSKKGVSSETHTDFPSSRKTSLLTKG